MIRLDGLRGEREEAPEHTQSRPLLIAASLSVSRLPMTGVSGRQRTGAIGNSRPARYCVSASHASGGSATRASFFPLPVTRSQ
ncbi:hypothetical protein QF001_002807 [Paraburkholderia youngii]